MDRLLEKEEKVFKEQETVAFLPFPPFPTSYFLGLTTLKASSSTYFAPGKAHESQQCNTPDGEKPCFFLNNQR